MSDTVKLIIEIPKETKQAFDKAESNDLKGGYYDCGGVIGKAIQNGTPLDEGDLISRQAIEEIKSEIPKIHELFDIAYEYNKEDSTRTELSQKCTTYLLDVWQTLGAIVDNFPSVEKQGEWIPVSERLPEERTAVLVYVPEWKNIYCAYYEPKNEQWWIFGTYTKLDFEVVSWQPLPEPYKAESEDKE